MRTHQHQQQHHHLRVFVVAVLALAFSGFQTAQATTLVSHEQVALGQIATAMKAYAALHDGQRANNWSQVGEILDLSAANKSCAGKSANYLQQHYEFLFQRVPLPGYEGSEVVMIRTVPLAHAEGQPKWRYLVARSKDGNINAIRLPEVQAQEMFKKAGVSLPIPKPGLAAVEIETVPDLNALYGFRLWQWFLGAAGLIIVIFLFIKRRV